MKELMQELRQKITFDSIKNKIDTKKDVISYREFRIETKYARLKDFPYVSQGRVSSIEDAENIINIVLNDEGVTNFISKYERIVLYFGFFMRSDENMLYLEISFYPN